MTVVVQVAVTILALDWKRCYYEALAVVETVVGIAAVDYLDSVCCPKCAAELSVSR